MELKVQQLLFKEGVCADSDRILPYLSEGGNLSAADGLQIYREAYSIRMRSYLEDDFPQTFSFWNETEKNMIVRSYSMAYPSSSPTATDFGANFSPFLASRKWPARLEFLPEMARLEWLMVRAKHAASMEEDGWERVTTASESDWMRSRFVFDPSLHLLESSWPLLELYEAKSPNIEVKRGASSLYIVYLEEGLPMLRELEEMEGKLLHSLYLGLTLGEVMARFPKASLSASTFQEWTSSGILKQVKWDNSTSH